LLVMSPDARYLAAPNADGSITVWDVEARFIGPLVGALPGAALAYQLPAAQAVGAGSARRRS
jgi:hypothetical protein